MWNLNAPKPAKLIIGILAILIQVVCHAEPIVLTQKQAVADLDYLVRQVVKLHPDPFKHTPKEFFDSNLAIMKDGLPSQISRCQFSLLIAKLLASLRDSHTTLPLYESPDFTTFHKSGNGVFPLQMRFSDGQMTIREWLDNETNRNLKKGDIITTVNDEPMESLIERYAGYISAETTVQQYWQLEQLFPVIHFLDKGHIDRYQITFQEPNCNTKKEILTPVKWNSSTFFFGITDRKDLFTFSFYEQKKICLFKAQTFFNGVRDIFIKKLSELISQIEHEGTTILIVDLRGNGGGSGSFGWRILARTLQNPVRSASKYSKRTYKLLKSPKTEILNFEWLLPNYETITPDRDAWQGNLVLLCDRFTASAAVDTAVIVKDNKAGLIVGEETGGRASYFADVYTVILPNSRLKFLVPTSYFMRPAKFDDGKGVLPDLQLDVTLNDTDLVRKIYDYLMNVPTDSDAAGKTPSKSDGSS
jgi:C-terminal processing protease CtpA/Prc